MAETIQLGDIAIAVTRKDIKHVHLSVHPPSGRVTLVAPKGTRPEVARAYAVSKLGWIRDQQAKLRGQARETPRQFVERESHYLWGRRYLLSVKEEEAKPSVRLDSPQHHAHRAPRQQQREARGGHARMAQVPPARGGARADPQVGAEAGREGGRLLPPAHEDEVGRLQPPGADNIRLNTELVKKPKDLLEYVVVHEMLHLIEPTHSERFLALMSKHYPAWREARAELNELPLGAETWRT